MMSIGAVTAGAKLDVQVLETAYGPHIRHRDWEAEQGTARPGGGHLHLLGGPVCRIRRADYPYGGGGDVRLTASLDVDHVRQTPHVVVHFNAGRKRNPDTGFRVLLQRDTCSIKLAGEDVGTLSIDPVAPGARYDVTLTTLDRGYEVVVNGTVAASGTMPPPFTDNEGWTVIEARNCDARLLTFSESFVAHPQAAPDWQRGKLLYEETFTEVSLRENWGVNTSGPETGIELVDGAFVFRHMCNAFVKQRFDGPIVVDCTATPVPTDDFPAGVTDAIFIWRIDTPGNDFFSFLEDRSREGDAGLGGLMPLPFYWVDFGGTNNVTTRFRRNPHRHLIRQFTDQERLLERDRSYSVTLVQHGHYVEFHVGGQPWIQAYDSEPLTTGYVGFRAYCADLRLSNLKIWALETP